MSNTQYICKLRAAVRRRGAAVAAYLSTSAQTLAVMYSKWMTLRFDAPLRALDRKHATDEQPRRAGKQAAEDLARGGLADAILGTDLQNWHTCHVVDNVHLPINLR